MLGFYGEAVVEALERYLSGALGRSQPGQGSSRRIIYMSRSPLTLIKLIIS